MNNFPAMTEAQRQELIRHNRAKLNAITPQFLKESTPGVKKHLQREIDSAKIAIAALTAKPVGAIRIEMDWNTHRNVATLDMREDLVAADMATGDKLFTAPPAPVLCSPAYHDEAKRLAELHGMSFVVFRHGEAPAVADPTRVIIGFTDKGLGHDTTGGQQ